MRDSLIDAFGADRKLPTMLPDDADDWRLFPIGRRVVAGTVRRQVSLAELVVGEAKRPSLASEKSPEDLQGAVHADPSPLCFVTRQTAQKVINACPDVQRRLLFALGRYGGLRCPSEQLALRWGDVTWEHSCIAVR